MKSTTYRDLIVWQKALVLVFEVYELTSKLPKDETYGLSSQMRRAAVSIPSNIAEGSKRKSLDFGRFCSIADGSAAELETQMYILKKLYDIDCDKYIHSLQEVQKMLYRISQKLTKPT